MGYVDQMTWPESRNQIQYDSPKKGGREVREFRGGTHKKPEVERNGERNNFIRLNHFREAK